MKRKYKIAAIIFALLFIVLVVLCWPKTHKKEIDKELAFNKPEQQQEQTQEIEYQSPVDFEKLQKINSDICAWLDIPGTDISYPVVQNAKDDTFYLNHDETGESNVRGALFTEHVYNKNDFSDPVTAIYGHHMLSGEMFGNLQQYYTDDFDKYSELIIYMPNEEIHYKVFAAVAFSNRHILYYYDNFKSDLMMGEFLEDLKSVRAIGSFVDKDVTASTDDQLLVLSTCLQGDRTCRFLVIGKRAD